MPRRARREPASLSECFESRVRTYARLPWRWGRDLRRALFAHSPLHFARGDMRREYGWTRALLTAGATVAGVALLSRLLLTGLFVTLVSADVPLVVLFNLCVSLLLGRTLLGVVDTEPRTRRRVVTPRSWRMQSTRRRRGVSGGRRQRREQRRRRRQRGWESPLGSRRESE
ncbi:hypothetical protein SAMN04487948_12560 [Halogranum amylolyticum]|uniref:Uncharacterized protein n=1 Tax=Halogranum amylolyticum TaxID=660520 RepID=A0A1H8W918_9EURY|nr:hypothetical protein [Halogranum amylolyticum]SEP24119.1 hypothetical protein SAMN04487948_12560 [Halogranum amylolyticum]